MANKILLLLLALVFVTTSLNATNSGITLQLRNGSSISFTFEQKPVVVTSENIELRLKDGSVLTYTYGDVQKLYWNDDKATKVEKDTTLKQPVININGNRIIISGLVSGENVNVYNVNGMAFYSKVVKDGRNNVNIDIKDHGVYIVHIGNRLTFKFKK